MKKVFVVAVVVITAALAAVSQADVSKLDGALRAAMSSPSVGKAALGKAVAIVAERETIDCLVKSSDTAATSAAIIEAGGEAGSVFKTIMVARIPLDAIVSISDREEVLFIEAAKPMSVKMNAARAFTRASDVQEMGYYGSRVLVGVVDNALDYDHADFQGSDGDTRICYLYYKSLAGGVTECTNTQINEGECGISLPGSLDYHGSHVTGIATGADSTYTGVGASANIAFSYAISSDADSSGSFSTTVLDGVSAIFTKADSLDLPSVINLSLGTSWGAHDDTSLVEQGLDEAVTGVQGRVIVDAAGNEDINSGDPDAAILGGIHAPITVNSGSSNGYSVALRSTGIGSYISTAVVDVWLQDSSDCRNATIEVKGYLGSDFLAHTYNTSTQKVFTTAKDFNADNTATGATADGKVGVTVNTYTTNTNNSRPEALIYIGPTSTGSWSNVVDNDNPNNSYFFDVIIRGVSGTCYGDMWLYPDQTALIDFFKGIAGIAIAGTGGYQLQNGDSNKTTTIPGTASGVITVGSYMGRASWVDIDGTTQYQTDPYGSPNGATGGTVDSISLFSSLGPTGERPEANARIKPDVVAPGEPIISTMASATAPIASNAIKGDLTHFKLEGTSMSSPHVAGIVAQMLEKNNCLTATEVKSALTSGAVATGTPVPNNTYGYGKVDAVAAMGLISADTSCYAGTACGSSNGGGGGCMGTLVPVAAPAGIISIAAILIPLGIIITKRRRV